MDSIAYLIKQNITVDELGQEVETDEKQTPIFITVKSITRAEFFAAGRAGLTPDFLFETAAINYSGEKIIDFAGERFYIYRVFRDTNKDTVELYVERKSGEKK